MLVHHVVVNPRGRELHITLIAHRWSHSSVRQAVETSGRRIEGQIFFDACIKLGRPPIMSRPAYEIISRMNIFENILPDTIADSMIDRVHGLTTLGCAEEDEEQQDAPIEEEISLTTQGHPIVFTPDQRQAVGLGCAGYPTIALQVAPRTDCGTASTNAAVAQFAETLLSIADFSELAILRYVSDTSMAEERSPLPVDLNEVLKSLGDDFAANLSDTDRPPVRVSEPGGCVTNIAARAAPSASLVTTFRAHPLLDGLPNTAAYEGTLIGGANPAQRRMLLDLMTFPDEETPFLFLDVAGNSERATSRSHFNEAEATVCTSIIDRLMGKGVSPVSIYIISFYKEQLRRLEEYAARAGIELETVDSVQGRRKDIVILLTTRTDFDPLTAEFLDDPRRMNVALTRCRQGLFVLGHVESLQRTNFWSIVLAWAPARNVPAADLGNYLSAV
ncbi:hypothetical protein ANCCEY_03047 [Ancylostoma ceylanicum]|uniref:DNA2/NAM7 helicase-like C-terminal domain-containing protein n=1 Tax=Ancylostoma ceylanicum TaxID=53326 RepID=A0A0D6M637_9BILA|nr:hypothetical protein ANCCEY_03047 [Ancylostoma ceylanicum]